MRTRNELLRILGAGIGEENALWTARSFSTRGWSDGGYAGGARTWIAPEEGPYGFFSRRTGRDGMFHGNSIRATIAAADPYEIMEYVQREVAPGVTTSDLSW